MIRESQRHLRPEDLRGKRWRGLVRESSQEQAEQWSPDAQRHNLERAAEELGLVPAAAPMFYERVGSGEDERVTELVQALEDGKRGEYDVLVVMHTSRFARNRAESVVTKRDFRKAGIVIYFVVQRIISGTFASSLHEGISEVIDEHGNEERRFWIAGGQKERQLTGRWIGRIPYGYRRKLVDFPDGTRGWDGELEPNPDEAYVGEIYDLFLKGETHRSIAHRLTARGIRPRKSETWNGSVIRSILTNPVYRGRLIRYRLPKADHYYRESDPHDGQQEVAGMWPPLVDEWVWNAAQEIIERRRKNSAAKTAHSPYPLSGVVRCGACGSKMTGAYGNGGPGKELRRYYRCAAKATHAGCDAPSIRAEKIEGLFAAWLASFTLPEDWRTALAATVGKSDRRDMDAKRRKLEERVDRLKKLYAWGDLTDADYRAQIQAAKAELATATPASVGAVYTLAEAIGNMAGNWMAVSGKAATVLPELLLQQIVVRNGKIEAFVARPEAKPLLDYCVPAGAYLYLDGAKYARVLGDGYFYADVRNYAAEIELRYSA